jgi:hypothetical protein
MMLSPKGYIAEDDVIEGYIAEELQEDEDEEETTMNGNLQLLIFLLSNLINLYIGFNFRTISSGYDIFSVIVILL